MAGPQNNAERNAEHDADIHESMLAGALGEDNTYGYHLDNYGQTTAFWGSATPERSGRFPCLGPDNAYSGCLGASCQARTCWAGALVPAARRVREAMPIQPRSGARCHSCIHAVDASGALIDCKRGHYDRPITLACLLRQRIPASAPLPCPDYEQATSLRREVIAGRVAHAERRRQRALVAAETKR